MNLRLVIGETLTMRPLDPKSIEVAQQEYLEINIISGDVVDAST